MGPAPTELLRGEAAHRRTQGWSEEGRRDETAPGHRAIDGWPNVCRGTSADGEGRRAEEPGEEAADEESCESLREAGPESEECGQREGDQVDGSTTMEFGEGCCKDGPEGQTEDEEGEAEEGRGAGDVELASYGRYTRRVDGGAKCTVGVSVRVRFMSALLGMAYTTKAKRAGAMVW